MRGLAPPEYQAEQHRIYTRYLAARTYDEKTDALAALLAHAQAHSSLIEQLIAYQSDRGNFAQEPEWLQARRDNTSDPQAADRVKQWFADSVRRGAAATPSPPTEPPPNQQGHEENTTPNANTVDDAPPPEQHPR